MDGILVVDKPQGLTSHDVVDRIRHRFGLKKVGHAGTLDPMATGVLVLLIGNFTKSSPKFSSEDKVYEATMTLGFESDTGDAWGNVRATADRSCISNDGIDDAFKRFVGEIEQFPPMYSAVKFKGRKLYELARKGIKVDVKPRKICIKKIEITRKDLPEVSFTLTCSKGTYVRQLCVDIGRSLGCGAYLSFLRRTRSGRFSIDDAVSMSDIEKFGITDLEKRLCII